MNKINPESPLIQGYFNIIQGVIDRMAANSASCKNWCIGLVSAIILVSLPAETINYTKIAIMPILLFFILDSYYLSLERKFRELYNDFIHKLNSNSATIEDTIIIAQDNKKLEKILSILKATISISILPFYILMILMLYIISKWIS